MSENLKTKNDIAWEFLFDKYDILSAVEKEGKFIISSSAIRELREPRLMAKIDHTINLPKIFLDNKLAILPISRGEYIISHFAAYHDFEPVEEGNITKLSLPKHIQSLNEYYIPSEAIAVNCAFASGMLSDFLEDEDLFPTVSGRMGSEQFDFGIQNTKTKEPMQIRIRHSQIEIDAAFEGVNTLSLLEAKRDISKDFIIRQLYYPYCLWNNRVTKKVRPIFLVYSNGIFRLYEYTFQDPNMYNSLILVKHKRYTIEDTDIEISDIQEIASCVNIVPEPEVSFPQANSFERVVNLCELLDEEELSREQVTEKYAFDVRQTNYYTDAAIYLGVVEKHYEEKNKKPVFSLTAKGRQIIRLKYKKRQLAFCELILQHRVFYDVFKLYMDNGVLPEDSSIVSAMKDANLYRIESEETFRRRASTIKGWLNWIVSLTK